jgi:hypothetical protein
MPGILAQGEERGYSISTFERRLAKPAGLGLSTIVLPAAIRLGIPITPQILARIFKLTVLGDNQRRTKAVQNLLNRDSDYCCPPFSPLHSGPFEGNYVRYAYLRLVCQRDTHAPPTRLVLAICLA